MCLFDIYFVINYVLFFFFPTGIKIDNEIENNENELNDISCEKTATKEIQKSQNENCKCTLYWFHCTRLVFFM